MVGSRKVLAGKPLCQRVSWHLHRFVYDVTGVLDLSGEVEFTTDILPYMSWVESVYTLEAAEQMPFDACHKKVASAIRWQQHESRWAVAADWQF